MSYLLSNDNITKYVNTAALQLDSGIIILYFYLTNANTS